MITPERFRAELAGRLNQILPDGFHATPSGIGIYLDAPDGLGTWVWTGQVDRDPSNLESYSAAACNVLNTVQDCVAITLREVWPLETAEPEHRMAYPGSKAEGTVLYLWYGPEESPIVRLQPIDLVTTSGDR